MISILKYKLIIIINGFFASLPYSTKEVHLKCKYVSSDLGDCGIACVAMIVPDSSIHELIIKYKKDPYYTDPVGWFHHGLVEILKNNDVISESKKFLNLVSLRRFLENGKLVIVSLRVPHPDDVSTDKMYVSKNPRAKIMGHLCVLTGFDSGGFYLSDPRNIKGYSENVYVPYTTFAKIFTGDGVVAYDKI